MSSTWTTVLLFHVVLLSSAVTAQEEGYCDASNPNCQVDHIFEKLRNKLVVAAIDFGTTYSGWAYQTKSEYIRNKIDVKVSKWGSNDLLSKKTPTTVLIQPDGKTLEAFGYDAETRYSNLASEEQHTDYYYFRRFKMLLYGKKDLNQNTMLQDDKGQKLPAITVFSLAIGFLKDNLLGELQKTNSEFEMKDIHWVLTVPAIWNDTAKQFMRKSAVAAGIINEDLTIALEPEAASLYGRTLEIEKHTDANGKAFLNSFQPGKKYMVLDAGGGTIDITVHEVTPGKTLKELYKASGGPWGGTKVDDAFKEIIISVLGAEVFEKFKKECVFDHLELFRSFENIKRLVRENNNDKLTFHFPLCMDVVAKKALGKDIKGLFAASKYNTDIYIKQGRLWITGDMGRQFFKEPIENIIKTVQELLNKPAVKGTGAILMVGGFSDSPMLYDAIKNKFSSTLTVFRPKYAELAVVKGAVIFGFRPSQITERVARFTYGVRMNSDFNSRIHRPDKRFVHKGRVLCKDIFSRHVKIGTKIKYGTVQAREEYVPIHSDQTEVVFAVVACETENPFYVTEDGCHVIGQTTIPITDRSVPLQQRLLIVEFSFSDTEIKVLVTEKRTKKKMELYLNFL